MVGAERSVHDAEEPSAVPASVPAADDRVGPARPDAIAPALSKSMTFQGRVATLLVLRSLAIEIPSI